MDEAQKAAREKIRKDHEQLLRVFEPVLRFSTGERFFPMDVETFVKNCRLKKAQRFKWFGRDDNTQKLGMSNALLASALGENINNESSSHYYLHFVHGKEQNQTDRYTIYPRIILLLSMLLLVVLPGYGLLTGRIWLLDFPFSSYVDVLKALVVASVIIVWPLFQIDRKAYLAFGLIVISLLFFGTEFGRDVALFGCAICVAFGIACVVFRLWTTVVCRLSRGSLYAQLQKKTILRFFNASLIFLLLVVTAYVLYTNIQAIWACAGRQFIDYFLILEFLSLVILATLFWFVLSASLRKIVEIANFKQQINNQWLAEVKRLIFEEQTKPMLVMSIAAMVVGLCFSTIASVPNPFLESTTWVIMGILAATALLWYALDPLPIWRPNLLYPYDKRQRYFAWNWRILMCILAGILLWYAANEWFLYLAAYSAIHQLTLYYAVQALTIVLVGLIMGSKMMSAFLDTMSRQADLAADYAAKKYHEVYEETSSGRCYYGRVCECDGWTVLQYHYFYAFNDYRRIAGGMNNHEGDWEAVAVYLKHEEGAWDSCPYQAGIKEKLSDVVVERLKRLRPYGVAYSQHHNGEFRFWEDVKKVQRKNGEMETCHPLVYPALGSHANYPVPDEYPASAHFTGTMQRVVAQIDEGFRKLHTRVEDIESVWQYDFDAYIRHQRQLLRRKRETLGDLESPAGQPARGTSAGAASVWVKQASERPIGSQNDQIDLIKEFRVFYRRLKADLDQFTVKSGLLFEYATGDGLRVGFDANDITYLDEFKLALYLPPGILARRRESMPDGKGYERDTYWRPKVLLPGDEYAGWVAFQGLWGCSAWQMDEAGPSGPKWSRPKQATDTAEEHIKVRLRWGPTSRQDALLWKDMLLMEMLHTSDTPVQSRIKALRSLISDSGKTIEDIL